MKNKQVKKMMSDVFDGWFGGDWFYYRGDFICAVPIAAGSHGMILSGCSGVASITGNQHQLQSVAKGWKARCNR